MLMVDACEACLVFGGVFVVCWCVSACSRAQHRNGGQATIADTAENAVQNN
jgi:hypothetical protein